MNKTSLHLSVTPVWLLGVYTHHALLITCMSPEPSVISHAITGIKQPYFINWSYLLIALIASTALRISLPCSWWNLWTSKQKTDMYITMPDRKRGEASPRCGSRHLHASSPHGIPSGCWENLCCAMMGNRGIWLRSPWLLVGCGYTPFAAALNRFLQGNAWASISLSTRVNNLSSP